MAWRLSYTGRAGHRTHLVWPAGEEPPRVQGVRVRKIIPKPEGTAIRVSFSSRGKRLIRTVHVQSKDIWDVRVIKER